MIKKSKEKDYQDSGFSSKPNLQGTRLLNKDGSFRAKKVGLGFWEQFSLFHTLHQMSWTKFIIYIFLFYSIVNFIFSFVYLAVGVEGISGAIYENKWEEFLQAFFFSCQTITTVGFGALSPNNTTIQVISSLEAFVGLMLFAIMTGMLYGRFAKPRAEFIFSEKVIVSPYQDGHGIMFRLANAKNTDMINANVDFLVGYLENGKRKFAQLGLERGSINFLPTSWTVVHPLNDDSIFKNWSPSDYIEKEVEFMVTIMAYDNTYDQNVNTRTSYKGQELEFNKKFVSMTSVNSNGEPIVDLSLIGTYESV